MYKRKIIIILSIVLLLIGMQVILSPLFRKLSLFILNSATPLPTPASPVNTLSGLIESKGFNSFTIVQYNKKVYKVKIVDKTVIFGLIPALPQALFSLTPPQPKKLGLNDLKNGQAVSVNTITDLRNAKITEFEATSIQLPQVITTLTGMLVDIRGSDLFLKIISFSDPGNLKNAKKVVALPLEKTYTVKTNKNTAFFLLLRKITLSDLKKNSQITVYSPTEITGRANITAQYVEVVYEPPPALPPVQNNIAP